MWLVWMQVSKSSVVRKAQENATAWAQHFQKDEALGTFNSFSDGLA
jgi:hypothetical protein